MNGQFTDKLFLDNFYKSHVFLIFKSNLTLIELWICLRKYNQAEHMVKFNVESIPNSTLYLVFSLGYS